MNADLDELAEARRVVIATSLSVAESLQDRIGCKDCATNAPIILLALWNEATGAV